MSINRENSIDMGTVSSTLDEILHLYRGYSQVHRANTQPFRLQVLKAQVKRYAYNPEDLIIREPLIEHLGSLPVIATTVYPHIADDSVDLGRALVMLAIHDIGELVTGDEIVFTKSTDTPEKEKREALSLLPESYHEIYREMAEGSTHTALFARSIDKIAPDIVDLMTPAEVTAQRYKKFVGIDPDHIVSTIKRFKHPHMLWNVFMTELHLEVLVRIDTKLLNWMDTTK